MGQYSLRRKPHDSSPNGKSLNSVGEFCCRWDRVGAKIGRPPVLPLNAVMAERDCSSVRFADHLQATVTGIKPPG